MAHVHAFRALRYDEKKLKPEDVTAPPYDVISSEEQNALYQKNPYNVVRLILGKENPSDNATHNRYVRAAEFLNAWRQEGVLVKDFQPHFYLYQQTYRIPDTQTERKRITLFAALKLEPLGEGTVYPHEKTHAKAKQDRMKLIREVKTNLSPVFGLYEDNQHVVKKLLSNRNNELLYDFKDTKHIRHELWKINDEVSSQKIQKMFGNKKIFIADGHHRYETALAYRDHVRSKHKNNGQLPSDFIYIGLCNMADAGLEILPIHRVLTQIKHFNSEEFLKSLSRYFHVHSTSLKQLQFLLTHQKPNHVIGLYWGGSHAYWICPKSMGLARDAMPRGRAKEWYELDVNWVSFFILKKVFKLSDHDLDASCTYTPSFKEAVSLVKKKKAKLTVLLRPTPLESVKKICLKKERMPQKSTFFYPKLPSGLLFYPHE
jgi:uncharacterized protein (DUF1015 family)